MLNPPPAQRALILLDHDPQTFWQAVQLYLSFVDTSDLAAGLRASVASLDAENRSQLALFIAGPDAGWQQLSSPQALNAEIARISTHPTFKASVEKFLRANPRAVGQLSSRLLQELVAVAESPQLASQSVDSDFLFPQNDRSGVRGTRRVRFAAPGWILPLGAFFFGSIITAFVISWLFGRASPGMQTVVTPVYLSTAKPIRSSAQRGAPGADYALPAQSIGQPIGSAPAPGAGSTLGDAHSLLRAGRKGPASSAPLKAATPALAAGGATAGAALQSPAPSGLTPAPDPSETPFTVEPENQTFVAVPRSSPAAAASMDPSALILTGPTPESVHSPGAPSVSPAPTATPVIKTTRKRIRLGYRCAKCH